MEKKTGILGYLSQVFMIYGITIFLISIFCMLFGENGKEVSTIFSLGSDGIAVSTMFEFFTAIALITVLRFVFMTDLIIKKMLLAVRIITMFAGTLGIIIGCIFAFGWFPVMEAGAWVMFLMCFMLSVGISTFISVLAEKHENQKLEEALKRFKEER